MTQVPRDIEDQIRRGLQDRANGVTPSTMTAADLLDRRPIEPDDEEQPQLTPPLTGDPFQSLEQRQWPRTPILVGLAGLACFVGIGLFSSNLAQQDRSPLTTVGQASDGQPDDLTITTATTSASSAAASTTSPLDQGSADTAPADTAPETATETTLRQTEPSENGETASTTAVQAPTPPVAMSVGSPVADQAFPNGAAIEFHGTAMSEQASIVIVRVVIQDLDTRLYLQPDGSFSKLWNAADAELIESDELVEWRHTQDPIPAGRYQVRLRAIDSANERTDWLLTPFSVSPDTA